MKMKMIQLRKISLIAMALVISAGCGQMFAQDAKGKVHEKVEVMPEFPGGKEGLFKYMTTAIKYPEDAEAKGIEGKVIVSFTVDTDGSVTDIKRLRSVHPSIDEQAVEVVSSMPKWTPGEQDGKKVKVKMNLPIVYKLK